MKTMIDTNTGRYLSQAAYDQWSEGKEITSDMWTSDIDCAASFVGDDAPTLFGDERMRYKIVEAP